MEKLLARFSFARQLFLLISLPLLAAGGSCSLLLTLASRGIILKEFASRGMAFTDALAKDARTGVETRNMHDSLELHLRAYAGQKDTAFAHVLDANGRILSSTALTAGQFLAPEKDRRFWKGFKESVYQVQGADRILVVERPVLSDTKPVQIPFKPAGPGSSMPYQIGTAVIGFSLLPVQTQMARIHAYGTLILAAVLIPALGLAWLFARLAAQRLRSIAEAARNFREGSYEQRLTVSGNDELAEVSAGFNEMAQELERLISELKDSNLRLEIKVQERTKELERALKNIQETQNQLIQSEKFSMIGHLAAGFAHDLNNPLTGILLTSQLALEGSPREKEDWESVARLAQRCKTVTAKLVNFSKGEPFSLQAVRLRPIIQQALEMFRHDAELHGVRIFNRVEDGLPASWAGELELRQAFGNIILNAFQAMPSGGELAFTSGITGDGKIAIRVQDTGNGMRRKEIEGISNGSALGMGLAAVRRILAQFGGKLLADSEGPGKGSVFTVLLPIYKTSKKEKTA